MHKEKAAPVVHKPGKGNPGVMPPFLKRAAAKASSKIRGR